MIKPLYIDIIKCRRCNADHLALKFTPFKLDPGTEHKRWALCPSTQEPMILGDCLESNLAQMRRQTAEGRLAVTAVGHQPTEEPAAVSDVAQLTKELAAVREEQAEDTVLLGRLGDILRATVAVFRGPPPPLTMWSTHDTAELAAAMKQRLEHVTTVLQEASDRGYLKDKVTGNTEGFQARVEAALVRAPEPDAKRRPKKGKKS